MEKKFFYTTYALITFIILTSCESKKSNLEESAYFVENIPQIQDSIVKLKTYNMNLVVCSLKKTTNHAIITLEVFDSPYQVQTNYLYKNIQGVNVLFVAYNEKLINKEIPKQLI